MKKVTKQNMLRYLDMREEYKQTHNKELLKKINKFIEEVINKDFKCSIPAMLRNS